MLLSQPRILVPLEILKWALSVVVASIGDYNVALSVFLSLLTFFGKSRATLRAHLSWCEVLVSFPQIRERTDCAREVRTF